MSEMGLRFDRFRLRDNEKNLLKHVSISNIVFEYSVAEIFLLFEVLIVDIKIFKKSMLENLT